jgi:hypothetical protein
MDPLALKFRIQVNYASPQEHVLEAEHHNHQGTSPYDLPPPTIQSPTLHHGESSH